MYVNVHADHTDIQQTDLSILQVHTQLVEYISTDK